MLRPTFSRAAQTGSRNVVRVTGLLFGVSDLGITMHWVLPSPNNSL